MKAISKVVAVLAVSALAFGMFGCSSNSGSVNTNADEAQTYTSEEIGASDITVEKSGYSSVEQTTIDADGNEVPVPAIDFAFIVKNNNTGYVAQNVPFNVNGYNANGEIVFSGGATCMYVYPGIDTAVSGTTTIAPAEGIDTNITEFTVEPLMSTVEWLKTGLSDAEIAGMFTVDNATAERTETGLNINATVTGDIADGDKIFKVADLENTLEGHCVAIFTDESGNILFGSDSTNVLIDQTTIDSVQAAGGEEAAPLNNVSITIQNAPEYADFQLYVMPGL